MLVEIAVVGLVSYRLFRLLSIDSITQPLRNRLPMEGWVGELWGCAWCLGSWCAIAIGLAAYFTGLTSETPWLVVPAASVVCGWLGEHL